MTFVARRSGLAVATAVMLAGVVLLLLLLAGDARASGVAADQCPTPSVSVFDLSVPPATSDKQDNVTLESSGGGVYKALFDDDASHTMIQYLDDQVVQNQQAGQTIKYGNNVLNLAPAGPLPGVDYLVTGSITGQPGAYTVSVSLQDAYTRAEVAGGSATFATAGQGYAAAEQAGDQLIPAFTKIRAYQQQQVAASDDEAILAGVTVTPERKRINVGESTPVKIRLADCDGQPLKGRSVKLVATKGTFTPASVRTNAQGEAMATFKAHKRGPAKLSADYNPYTTVTHHPNAAYGQALVDVDDPLTDTYVVDAQVDYTLQEAGQLTSGMQTASVSATASGTAHVIEWGTGKPGTPSFHLIATSVTGEYTRVGATTQDTALGLGYYCLATSDEEFASARPTGAAIEMSRPPGHLEVTEEVDFTGSDSEAGDASSLCQTPGATDSNVAEGFGTDLQNTGRGWKGDCGGSSTHIRCSLSDTYSSESNYAANGEAPTTESGTVDITIRQLRASEVGG